jgi:hypothetical protein
MSFLWLVALLILLVAVGTGLLECEDATGFLFWLAALPVFIWLVWAGTRDWREIDRTPLQVYNVAGRQIVVKPDGTEENVTKRFGRIFEEGETVDFVRHAPGPYLLLYYVEHHTLKDSNERATTEVAEEGAD